jgi:uncharacterized membrane protein YdjX (TVP38/TMEM64 family)
MIKIEKKYNRLVGTLLFLVILFLIGKFSGLTDQVSTEKIQKLFEGNIFKATVIYCVIFTVGNILQVPGIVFLAPAVLALGKFHGGLITYIAACISCFVTYFVVGFLSGDTIRNIKNPRIEKALLKLDERPLIIMFLLRLVFQTYPPLNYAFAMAKVPFRKYALATILAMPVPVTIYCLFFDFFFKLTNLR